VTDEQATEILEATHARFPLPQEWERRAWVPVARDRVGDHGAITSLQRSGEARFYSMTAVYARGAGGWALEFENGDHWPLPPTAPRPADGSPLAHVTGFSSVRDGETGRGLGFVAGVCTAAVAVLRARSAVEQHDVLVDPRTGAFVALTVHDEDVRFTLSALDSSGARIDRLVYDDPAPGGL
jgi:hypothetical protein